MAGEHDQKGGDQIGSQRLTVVHHRFFFAHGLGNLAGTDPAA
jgi:hypothetical protein